MTSSTRAADMLELIDEHVSRGQSFAFETTLAGKSYGRHIPCWQAAGYHVTLLSAGRLNFEVVYKRLVDAWALYDNSNDEPILLGWGEK